MLIALFALLRGGRGGGKARACKPGLRTHPLDFSMNTLITTAVTAGPGDPESLLLLLRPW